LELETPHYPIKKIVVAVESQVSKKETEFLFDLLSLNIQLKASEYSPEITYNVWVNVTSFTNGFSSGYMSVIDKVDNAGEGIELFVKSNGTLAMYVRTTAGAIDYDGSGNFTLTTGTWYMLTLTFTNGAGLTGYVNGNLDSNQTISSDLLNFSAVTAIGYGLDTSFPNRYFDGLIQDARVYSVALTGTQISALFSAGPQ
jgi:Concanavalin A-like lectin/glucanases superfamily